MVNISDQEPFSTSRQSFFKRATQLLARFVCLHRSLRSLRSFRLLTLKCSALQCSLRSLTRFALSLIEQCEFINMCSCCKRDSREWTRLLSSVQTRPMNGYDFRPSQDPKLRKMLDKRKSEKQSSWKENKKEERPKQDEGERKMEKGRKKGRKKGKKEGKQERNMNWIQE